MAAPAHDVFVTLGGQRTQHRLSLVARRAKGAECDAPFCRPLLAICSEQAGEVTAARQCEWASTEVTLTRCMARWAIALPRHAHGAVCLPASCMCAFSLAITVVSRAERSLSAHRWVCRSSGGGVLKLPTRAGGALRVFPDSTVPCIRVLRPRGPAHAARQHKVQAMHSKGC